VEILKLDKADAVQYLEVHGFSSDAIQYMLLSMKEHPEWGIYKGIYKWPEEDEPIYVDKPGWWLFLDYKPRHLDYIVLFPDIKNKFTQEIDKELLPPDFLFINCNAHPKRQRRVCLKTQLLELEYKQLLTKDKPNEN